MKTKFHYFFMLLALLASLTQTARAAVAFTVTPAAVSNTYSGKITLQVTGLASGHSVVVQKFLDANTNGAIDGADLLVQQFNMTDGQASVFHDGATAVTNFNVPGDNDTTAGQITAPINFQNGDFSQNIVGQYVYKLSSPVGDFAAITKPFAVTNFSYAQSFTGNVVSNNTATVVSNAIIILFQPSGNNNLHPLGGAVANNSGSYTIKAPPGTYLLAAVRSNYLANIGTAPTLTLGSGSMITTNLMLTNATQSISGKIVDNNTPTLGLPGFLVPAESTTNDFLSISFTDTNGNFTVGTRPDVWKISADNTGLIVHGYIALQNNIKTNTAGGSVTGLTNALPKATAIFYGSVKDSLGNPLAGIDVSSQDNNNNSQYQSDGYTDTNGSYVVGALAADWQVNISSDSSPTNYVFSNGFETTLTNGQAVQVNFTAILATNHITGHVEDSNGNPITGVGVSASLNINGTNYQIQVDTDDSGNYSLNVANGDWSVSVSCNGGGDSLDGILGSGNYSCPDNQDANIVNNNQPADFTVQLCGGVSIITTSPLTDGQAGSSYDITLEAQSCNPSFTWLVNDPADFPPGLTLDADGELHGTPTQSGTFNFSVNVTDGSSNTTNQNFSLFIAPNPTPPPPVGIASVAGNQAIIFYPLSGTNYVLQTTTNLASGNWVTATVGVQVIAFTFSNTAPAAFFRLH